MWTPIPRRILIGVAIVIVIGTSMKDTVVKSVMLIYLSGREMKDLDNYECPPWIVSTMYMLELFKLNFLFLVAMSLLGITWYLASSYQSECAALMTANERSIAEDTATDNETITNCLTS